MPIPITIITGYLGAGKTTLLNTILTGDHGRRIAVVQNEFGQIGIDHDLLMHVEDGLYTMNNGCICCTVRDDMIEAIEMLMMRGRAIDHIVIETTGMASPGSVVMTLLTHPDAGETFTLDGVVTLVDAAHIGLHLGTSPEVADQLAYADLVLLNKIDLVAPADIAALEEVIGGINPTAAIVRTSHAAADPGMVLDLGGFDPARLDLGAGRDEGSSDAVGMGAHAGHRHEEGVAPVAIQVGAAIDLERFERWVASLLADHHESIYRMKGILWIAGQPRRYIFQGVHALSSWQYGRRWEEGSRESRFVLIGRNLDAQALREGFLACVDPSSPG